MPSLRKDDDNVIPAASEIPGMISSLGHPRRRTISIGPQSEADVYEAIAVRQRKRRDSEAVEQQDATGTDVTGQALDGKDNLSAITRQDTATVVQDEEEEEEDRLLFQKLQAPRVRYDVEVVTKLIVYAGMLKGEQYTALEVIADVFMNRHRMVGNRGRPNIVRAHRAWYEVMKPPTLPEGDHPGIARQCVIVSPYLRTENVSCLPPANLRS